MAQGNECYPTTPGAAGRLDEAAAHHRAGRFHEAEVIYRAALAEDPKNAEAWQLLGLIAHAAGHHGTGASYVRRALELSPGNPSFLNNLGAIHEESGDLAGAEACFREAVRVAPGYAPALNNLGEIDKKKGEIAGAIGHYRAALRSRPDLREAESNYLSALNYDPGTTGPEVAREHLRLGGRRAALAPPPRPFGNPPEPHRRLRIGYLSPDFRRHAVARFFEPILTHHDRSRFEVFLYGEVHSPDAVTDRFRRLAAGWRRTVGRDAAEVAAQIRADGVDILVDLAGHTRHNRLDVMSMRPAPVSVTYLGYPNTTGLGLIDARIGDDVTDPPGEEDRAAERVVRLPGGFACFQPPRTAPGVEPPPCLATGRVTFGSHHPATKLNGGVCRLWARVLDAVPGSRLLLFRHNFTEEVVRGLRERLGAAGVGADRLEFRRPDEADDAYLSVYREIDLVLDAFPFNGHTMTCESLWMGVPVVTLRGDRPAGRLSATVLKALGLEGLTAGTPDEYVAGAAGLASDPGRLARLRRELRPLMKARLCDGTAFTAGLEDAYRRLWQDWAKGQTPPPTAATPGDLHRRGLDLVGRVDYPAAIACFEESIRLDPGQVVVYNSLGNALKREGRFEEAIRAFRAGIERDPLQSVLHSNLGEVYKRLTHFPEALTSYRTGTLNIEPSSFVHHNYLAATHYVPDWDRETVYHEHRIWGLKACAPRPSPRARPERRPAGRPLRVGYVSADFQEHPVARFIEPVLRNHDPSQIEVFIYAEVPVPDEVTRRLRWTAPNWRETFGRSAEEVARQVAGDRIDVLVDLTGHFSGSRLDVFALAPAPVQVSYLGYPDTTGLPAMDYRLTDGVLNPPGEPDWAVERLFRLPGAFFCFEPPATAPDPAPPPSSATGRPTFGSHHNTQKLNDGVLALWARVLREEPESRLLLLRSALTPPAAEWMRGRLRAFGVDPDRVDVRRPPSVDEHYLAVYNEIDVVLDAFPFTGHTTTCEALWMGVPVVTLRGDRPASRLSAAVLTPIGLTDLIADTPDAFVAAARRIANDPGRLAALRRGLRARMAPLCDGPGFTRGIEAAYLRMHDETAAGSRPAPPPPPPTTRARRRTDPWGLRPDRAVEIVVPVPPGGRDEFPVPRVPGRVETRVIEAADANLSRVFRDAYLGSSADVVIFKHNDFSFNDWDSFEAQLWGLLSRYPVVGAAGARSFSPQRLPWWQQTALKERADGINRGMVAHPAPDGPDTAGDAAPTFFGPPGPVAVLDGAMTAVLRRWRGEKLAGRFRAGDVAGWWELEFGRHFYDMAFSFNASRAFEEAGLGPACYAAVADVSHRSTGRLSHEWAVAARRFVARHGGAKPVNV